MAGKFRMFQTSYWQDCFVLELTPEERYFYVHILTNSRTNQLGCYEIPLKVMEMELGYNRETILKLIARFEEYGKIIYNMENGELFILNWHKYNWSKSPKVRACMMSELKELKTKSFVKVICEMMGIAQVQEEKCTSANECKNGANEVQKEEESLENQGETDCTTYSTDTVSIEYGEEKEKEKEKEEYICANDCTGVPSGKSLDKMFEEFYQAYPKKRNRQKALQAFKRLKPSQELFAVMMAMLAAWKQSEEWQKDGGQFIPLPSSWLNGRRWEDEVVVAMPKGSPPPKAESKTDVLEARRKAFMAEDED